MPSEPLISYRYEIKGTGGTLGAMTSYVDLFIDYTIMTLDEPMRAFADALVAHGYLGTVELRRHTMTDEYDDVPPSEGVSDA